MLGYNHPEDSVECLQSLSKSDYPGLNLLYTDNGSEEAAVEKVMREVPRGHVLRFRKNIGVGRGFNAGMAYAIGQGADFVFIINNDTKLDPTAISKLVRQAQEHAQAGILVPKIYYYNFPDTIWSAGSKFRHFPPVIVMQKTRGPDDGRYDHQPELQFTTFCAAMFRRSLLEEIGLLDTDFRIYQEDYDMSIRAREAGYQIRLVPDAHIWHKVSKSMKAGTPNPAFWHTYGRSVALFCRKHRQYGWMTGPVHKLYVVLRFLAEGKYFGLAPFFKGYREGANTPLNPSPRWNDPSVDRGEVLRKA